MKKYRKKKCTESKELNSSVQDDPTEENKQKKKIMPNERNQWQKKVREGFREKKRLNVLKFVHHVVS